MLPGGTDRLYRRILSAGRRHYVHVEVWSGLGRKLGELIPRQFEGEDDPGGLCFYSGSVSATLGSRVTRNLQITVPFNLYPVEATDLLAPFGNEIRAFRGVLTGDGSRRYTWPVFRGRIRTVEQTLSTGQVSVSCADRAADVVDADFVNPQNSQPHNTIFGEFVRLIRDALPDATLGASDSFSTRVKPLTWELNRSSALDEMATSGSGIWYALADGSFVMRVLPWTVRKQPVLTLSDGPGGAITDWTRSRSRESIYNVVTVTGERLNGDAPVYATASDNVATSPTYVKGGFGLRSLLSRLQTPGTKGSAQGAAATLLSNSIAPTETFNFHMPPDASMELGDVLLLRIRGQNIIQVVSGLTMPLDLRSDMMVSTRSLVVNRLEAGA